MKTTLIYEGRSPRYNEDITHLAIQTKAEPPYVWGTYNKKNKEDSKAMSDIHYNLSNDIIVIEKEPALRLFHLKKGEISDLFGKIKK